MHGRVDLSDRQAIRVLCAIDLYLRDYGDAIPPKDKRAVIAAQRKIEQARETILTKRIRAGLR
jgi:hypothetical protein